MSDEPQDPLGAEELLRESEERFRVMADCAPVALWMAGLDGLCTFFNQGWLNFTGRTMEQELGSGWAEGVHPEDFQDCMDTYFSNFNARRPFEMEYRLRRADGEYRWILDHGVPRYTPGGAFAGYIGSCVDITDRRRAEEVLKQSHADLAALVETRAAELADARRRLAEGEAELDKRKELDRMKDQFLGVVSHELRTPIAIVQGSLSNMSEPAVGSLNKEQARMLEIARGNTGRLARMINNLLDMSRLESGKVVPQLRSVDLGAWLKEHAQDFVAGRRTSGPALDVQVPPALPALRADPEMLEQVLANLLDNAFRYARRKILLRAGAVQGNGKPAAVRLSVADDGPGIPKDDQDGLFSKFHQLDRPVGGAGYKGTGLGLAICREIVTLHRGRIWVESAPGEGAAFHVELPV